MGGVIIKYNIRDKSVQTFNCMQFEADQFDETTFVFDNAMDNLYIVTAAQKVQKTPGNHKQGTVKKHPPRTLRQIYLMCKSKPVTIILIMLSTAILVIIERTMHRN